MQRLDYSTRERISTQSGAMALDAGRPTIGDAVKLFGLSSGLWLVVMVGLLMLASVVGGGSYEHTAMRLLRYFVGGLGAGLSALGVFYGLATGHIFVSEWYAYGLRRDAWHRAELRAYSLAGGQRVERQLTVRALTTQEPAHALLVALSLAERLRQGQIKAPSVDALQGDVWLGRVKVGELTKSQAEEFGQALAQVGLITGRRKGYAGQLATVDPAAIIELVTTRAGRIRQLAAPVGDSAGEESSTH